MTMLRTTMDPRASGVVSSTSWRPVLGDTLERFVTADGPPPRQAAEQGAQGGGIAALLVWSMLSSLALHLGIATACTLSGARRPRTRST